MGPLYLLDASIYIFRAWFSMPDRWHSPDGYPLNAVYGYLSFLLDLLQEIDAQRGVEFAAAFDESLGSCYRNRLYPGYKSSRELPDEALAFQLRACRTITEYLGIACFAGETFEADDYIASLSASARRADLPVCIVSRDKDLGQLLLGDGDSWWDYAAGTRLDSQGFLQRFGVQPTQFADYLGLVGDPVDDIPGVPGIGAKSAMRLLRAHDNLERLYQNLDELEQLKLRGVARIRATLQQHRDQAYLSRELARLADDIEGLIRPDRYHLQGGALENLLDYLAEIGLDGRVVRRCEQLQSSLRGTPGE